MYGPLGSDSEKVADLVVFDEDKSPIIIVEAAGALIAELADSNTMNVWNDIWHRGGIQGYVLSVSIQSISSSP